MFNLDLEEYNNLDEKFEVFDDLKTPVSLEVWNSYENLLKLLSYLSDNKKLISIKNKKEAKQHEESWLFLMFNKKGPVFLGKFLTSKKFNSTGFFELNTNYIITQLIIYVSFLIQINGYALDDFYEVNNLDILMAERILERVDKVFNTNAILDNKFPVMESDDLIHLSDINVILFWSACIALNENNTDDIRRKMDWFKRYLLRM